MSENLMLRQLFDKESSTYTYLLVDKPSREAILIDPVIEHSERDAKLVQELDLKLKYVMNTHVHADHITGTGRLKKLVPGAISVLCKKSEGTADMMVGHGEKIKFGEQEIEVAETPGHTAGCVTYIHRGAGCAFTGDALLIRGCGRTDFQGGSASTLYSSVWNNILSLPDTFNLYPAHDYKGQTMTTVAEEKKFNPRLTKTVDEFVSLMGGLNLPYPKKIDESLPANIVCGLHNLPERMKDWV
jgi:sulfur dioxygenase